MNALGALYNCHHHCHFSVIVKVILRGDLVTFVDEAGTMTVLSNLSESGAKHVRTGNHAVLASFKS